MRAIWRFAVERELVTEQPATQRLGRRAGRLKGEADAAKEGTLLHYFENLYKPLRLAGRSPAGVHQYRVVLRHFGRFLKRPATPADLDDLTVARFQSWLIETRGQGAITANKSLDKVLSLWRFLNRRRVVESYPEVRKLPEPERVPQAWLLADLEHFSKHVVARQAIIAECVRPIGGTPCTW